MKAKWIGAGLVALTLGSYGAFRYAESRPAPQGIAAGTPGLLLTDDRDDPGVCAYAPGWPDRMRVLPPGTRARYLGPARPDEGVMTGDQPLIRVALDSGERAGQACVVRRMDWRPAPE